MTTSALHQQVRRTIRRYGLCPPGSRLLVGLSGGSDSVALTLLLLDLAEHAGFMVAAAAHFNHQLRPAAAGDERFCRDFAARVGLPIVSGADDVQDYAARERLSVEDAARRLRYDFLRRAAADAGAQRIAVGHTRDDLAETFLLKVARGAGATGLGGIYPRRGDVIRPLLDVGRVELREFLRCRGAAWVDDETNAGLGNARSRVRHQVLPELERALGGAVAPSLARAAGLIREDAVWLDELSERKFAALAEPLSHGVQLDATALEGEPLPVRRRIVRLAVRAGAGERQVELEHVNAVLDVLEGFSGGADLPASRVELRAGKLVLLRQGGSSK